MKKINEVPNTDYLKTLTDQFGVWQHSQKGVIDRSSGYALDDAARALIVFLLYENKPEASICFDYIEKSYSKGKFYGFFDENQNPISFPSSEDAFNLAYWALSYCIVSNFRKESAIKLQNKLIVKENSKYVRSLSYLLISRILLNQKQKSEEILQKIIKKFNYKLGWFESKLYYANALIPYSLLVYLNHFDLKKDNKILQDIIKPSIVTLENEMHIGIIPAPTGNRKFVPINSLYKDIYGQQPIDAAFMVLMYLEAYKYFGTKSYLDNAELWLKWFYGNNIFGQSLITNNGCADGIDQEGISQNFGAESTIMFLWASHQFAQLKPSFLL